MSLSNRFGSTFMLLSVSILFSFSALSTAQARMMMDDDGSSRGGGGGYAAPQQPAPAPAPQPPPAPQESVESIVRQMYQQELHREGDAGGIQYWISQMYNGLSKESLRSYFQYVCQTHMNGECPVAPAPVAQTYTCTLTPGPGYNCFRYNYVQTTGFYTCSNGAKVAIMANQYTCAGSYTLPFEPVNNKVYREKPGVGISQ